MQLMHLNVMSMPEWVVHLYTGENFCGIRRSVCEEVNKFIDSIVHDVGRIIVDGRWSPEALLYLAVISYERWGYEGVKAVIHHHMLDYSNTLASSGKYGWLLKHRGPNYVIADVMKLCNKVLDGVEKDLTILLDALKSGVSLDEVVLRIEETWGAIQRPKFFADILRGHGIKLSELLEGIIRIVEELKGCMRKCVEEVAWLEFWGGFRGRGLRGSCPICMHLVQPLEACVLMPMEYAKKGLAYRVHRECFERLKARAKELLRQGLSGEELFERLRERSLPPSIRYEVLKAIV
jgi:hypothetical protein